MASPTWISSESSAVPVAEVLVLALDRTLAWNQPHLMIVLGATVPEA
jgi:hypothetical protein